MISVLSLRIVNSYPFWFDKMRIQVSPLGMAREWEEAYSVYPSDTADPPVIILSTVQTHAPSWEEKYPKQLRVKVTRSKYPFSIASIDNLVNKTRLLYYYYYPFIWNKQDKNNKALSFPHIHVHYQDITVPQKISSFIFKALHRGMDPIIPQETDYF